MKIDPNLLKTTVCLEHWKKTDAKGLCDEILTFPVIRHSCINSDSQNLDRRTIKYKGWTGGRCTLTDSQFHMAAYQTYRIFKQDHFTAFYNITPRHSLAHSWNGESGSPKFPNGIIKNIEVCASRQESRNTDPVIVSLVILNSQDWPFDPSWPRLMSPSILPGQYRTQIPSRRRPEGG